MGRTNKHIRKTRRPAITLGEVLIIAGVAVFLFFLLLPSGPRSRELPRRAVCAANLRGIGQGMHIYANDNMEWFPHDYYETKYNADATPPEHGVSWVGTMGSNDFLKISEKISKDKSPSKNHPSRSSFLMIIQGSSTPKQFICPDSGDQEDNLRNFGPDAGGDGKEITCQPGVNRFDFRGYRYLSYGSQLPYGPKAQPRESIDTRMAVAADKGPYYEDAGAGLAGTDTRRDRRSAIQPPAAWAGWPLEKIQQISNDKWRSYNSRNHNGEGQNVLFVDGHVEFCKKPIVGKENDNIYTIQNSLTDPRAALIGVVPNADQTWGPLTETDSFIVP